MFTSRRDLLGGGLVIVGYLLGDLGFDDLLELLRAGYRRDGDLVPVGEVRLVLATHIPVTPVRA